MIVKATIVDAPRPAAQSETRKWSAWDYSLAAVAFTLVLCANIATVFNNAYSFGATLFDSTIYQTAIWRNLWGLGTGPVIGTRSSFHMHLYAFDYIPAAISYFVPFDRMTYYALVYAIVYASLVLTVFTLFRRVMGGRALAAMIGSLLFFLSGAVSAVQWEPHPGMISALFTVAFFFAWALRRQGAAIVLLVLNASVREDCGAYLAAPLLLFGLYEWWRQQGTRLSPDTKNTLMLAGLSLSLCLLGLVVKQLFFHEVNAFSYYYGAQAFSHLSAGLILDRLHWTLLHDQYLLLPGLVLVAAALWLRDIRLSFGWIALLPYWLFNFLSTEDISAHLASYKSFPFILAMVWPAVLALRAPKSKLRALIIVQVLLLAAGNLAWEDGALRFAPPSRIQALVVRWTFQPETGNAAVYRAFEARLASGELGHASASQGALALYPYSFPFWTESWIAADPAAEAEAEAPKLDSLLWFTGDRDQRVTEKWLQSGNFPYFYRVIGTKLFVATRKPPDQLSAFAGALQPAAWP